MLFGIDQADPITPDRAKAAGAQFVGVYIGGVNNGGWRWKPAHAQALRDAGYKLYALYVGQNVGYAAWGLNYAQGKVDGTQAVALAREFGFVEGDIISLDVEYGTYENQPLNTIAYTNGFDETVYAAKFFPAPYITMNQVRGWTPTVPSGCIATYWTQATTAPDPATLQIPNREKFVAIGWQFCDQWQSGQFDGDVFEDAMFDGAKNVGQEKMVLVLEGQISTDGERRFFPQTGHGIEHGFRAFWETYGNVPIFGYPISEEFSWDDGTTVQYFQRARFEYRSSEQGKHPALYDVELGLVGQESGQYEKDKTANPNAFTTLSS